MVKQELIETISDELNITQLTSKEYIDTFFGCLTEGLIDSRKVEIRGFGSFIIKNYGSYKGRNPKTGESLIVSAKKLPFWKTGKGLQQRVNEVK